jgi:hypothetical protein
MRERTFSLDVHLFVFGPKGQKNIDVAWKKAIADAVEEMGIEPEAILGITDTSLDKTGHGDPGGLAFVEAIFGKA